MTLSTKGPLPESAETRPATADVMLFGVLRMPYVIAMGDEISRFQYYARGQEAADTITELRARVAELEKDARRLDYADTLCEAYGLDYHEGNRWVLDGPFGSIRVAIDAYMESTPPSAIDAMKG